MDWFLYDNGLRHERDKEIRLVLHKYCQRAMQTVFVFSNSLIIPHSMHRYLILRCEIQTKTDGIESPAY